MKTITVATAASLISSTLANAPTQEMADREVSRIYNQYVTNNGSIEAGSRGYKTRVAKLAKLGVVRG